jgi:sulfur carrier protein
MRITLNGENREVTEGHSVASLLSDLGIPAERVAVELNLTIVDRQAFTGTSLRDGDRLEVIGFIGGGKSDDDER